MSPRADILDLPFDIERHIFELVTGEAADYSNPNSAKSQRELIRSLPLVCSRVRNWTQPLLERHIRIVDPTQFLHFWHSAETRPWVQSLDIADFDSADLLLDAEDDELEDCDSIEILTRPLLSQLPTKCPNLVRFAIDEFPIPHDDEEADPDFNVVYQLSTLPRLAELYTTSITSFAACISHLVGHYSSGNPPLPQFLCLTHLYSSDFLSHPNELPVPMAVLCPCLTHSAFEIPERSLSPSSLYLAMAPFLTITTLEQLVMCFLCDLAHPSSPSWFAFFQYLKDHPEHKDPRLAMIAWEHRTYHRHESVLMRPTVFMSMREAWTEANAAANRNRGREK